MCKKILSIASIICTISCSSTQEKRNKAAYIEEFKMVYFKACLQNSFDNEAIKQLNHIDRSGMTEPILGTDVYPMIDSLANTTAAKVYKRSDENGEIAEGAEGKHVYSECLAAYQSKWLDSIANAAYKKQNEAWKEYLMRSQ